MLLPLKEEVARKSSREQCALVRIVSSWIDAVVC